MSRNAFSYASRRWRAVDVVNAFAFVVVVAFVSFGMA
jgi:hypothetical protein